MKKVFQFLISMPFMVVLLLIYATAMGIATFIESSYGPPISRYFVYGTWWFELIQFLLVVNFIGNIFKYKLYKRPKWGVCLLHLGFVVILIGAAVTRYTGYEGMMHIREGDTENKILSEKSYMQVHHTGKVDSLLIKDQLFVSPFIKNKYKNSFSFDNKNYDFELVRYIPNAIKSLQEDPTGYPIIEMVITAGFGMQSYYLLNQSLLKVGGQKFYLNTGSVADSGIIFRIEKNKLYMEAPMDINRIKAKENEDTLLTANTKYEIKPFESFGYGQVKFSVLKFHQKAKIAYVEGNQSNEHEVNILYCTLKSSEDVKDVYIPVIGGQVGEPVSVKLNNQQFLVSYGGVDIQLPFALKLRDFQLERYPGSESPSSFASEVTLIDTLSNINKEFRIFMNNILDYKGYRFFQSSYDHDEKGTILSVSHDKPGTYISYFGYFLMTLGMIWSLFGRTSYFAELWKKLSEMRTKRSGMGAGMLLIFLFIAGSAQAHDHPVLKIDKEHARQFGTILVQDHAGRIKPLNTLTSELLRKISRKEKINGLDHNQVILGMMFNPEFWQDQPMIKVTHPDLQKLIGTDQKLVSFNQFIDENSGEYKLKEYLSAAYETNAAKRDKYTKELIAVDEKVNLAYQIFSAQILKIFPVPNDTKHRWLMPSEAKTIEVEDAQKFATGIFLNYYNAIVEAQNSGNWTNANQKVDSLVNYQVMYAGNVIQSKSKIKAEIHYINADIFNRIFKFYGIIGFVYLIILLIGVIYQKVKLGKINLIITIILALIFLLHTYGLGLRWYVAGHAPWSNGYETMIFISWAIMLAGFIFVKRSPIVLAATAVLASVTLMVAHLSWMDPQITNLMPVLRSYWLTIHVSVITSSYGFMGLGAILGLINLIIMIMKNKANRENLEWTLEELTIINRMALIIGICLLSIGTFLGAVWANESWGRYWGWDPKETWALISIIVYTLVLHSRFIPSLNNKYVFNVLALTGLSSILMTFFGVNYYLSGLHSYAQGDPVPVPGWVYVSVVIVVLISIVAYFRNRIADEGK
jgi:cytochrome c-type biogenesis protein CcsB